MLDWLIVGGGVHGTHLSLALRSAGVRGDRLLVLDPHEEPLDVFFRHVDATSMQYLRSPAVHHLALDPYGLKRFARRAGRRVARFFHPYDRPGLALFREHVASLVRQEGLRELRRRAWAQRLVRRGAGFVVETSDGALTARRVVLAPGHSTNLELPAWATHGGLSESHLFAPSFSRATLRDDEPLVVVGGGISAAQLACSEARRRGDGATVTIVARHAPRVFRFDSDPEWLGPLAMRAFQRDRSVSSRRRMIQEARHRGSMPPEVHSDLRRLIHEGRLAWRTAEVTAATRIGACTHRLDLSDGASFTGQVVLARASHARDRAVHWSTTLRSRWGFRSHPAASPYSRTGSSGRPGSTSPGASPSSSWVPAPATSSAPV